MHDHAPTQPWTVDKNTSAIPTRSPTYCTEDKSMVDIAGEAYFLSAEGLLIPVCKDQPPPDLRYFKHARD